VDKYVADTQGRGRVIWIMNQKQGMIEPVEDRGYWDVRSVRVGSRGWVNSWSCASVPATMEKQDEWQVGVWISGKYRVQGETWVDGLWTQMEAVSKQENMYGMSSEENTSWKCGMCQGQGVRWNKWYGKCEIPGCGGVRMEGTLQDTSPGRGRRQSLYKWGKQCGR